MEEPEKKSNRLETYCGLLLAVFAAILAIADLGGGKYGDDEIIETNEKSSAYMWYQSKSIKESLAEGQGELLKSLLKSGVIVEDKKAAIESVVAGLDKEVERYSKEKKEILLGSKVVGKENWIQELDGKFGQVIGVKEWEEHLQILARAGDYFDLATLFLQLALVMGAISLISSTGKSKKAFFMLLIGLGLIGSTFTLYAFSIVH
ncbi:MAG: DUF4337 domain-containing protein [Sporocytophaga sp.]|nr:DUF4337 domain-containing protein [Sporocytophaga sp.]